MFSGQAQTSQLNAQRFRLRSRRQECCRTASPGRLFVNSRANPKSVRSENGQAFLIGPIIQAPWNVLWRCMLVPRCSSW